MNTVPVGQDRTGNEGSSAGEGGAPAERAGRAGGARERRTGPAARAERGRRAWGAALLDESEVTEIVGPKGRQDPGRTAVRHGHEGGEVTLGGRRVGVSRPRVRTADGTVEVPLATYDHFARRDPLTALVLEQMLAGVSTRRLARTREPVGEQVTAVERSASKSANRRAFIAPTQESLDRLMGRRLDDVRLAVLMLDGIDLKGRTNVVALGITTGGGKLPLGLWEGSTELRAEHQFVKGRDERPNVLGDEFDVPALTLPDVHDQRVRREVDGVHVGPVCPVHLPAWCLEEQPQVVVIRL